ncbi:type II toxin-antitoxin system ParD family antitoxin [Mesorhizobium sp. GbtcB19]|nr:type II toxin-antitoxin system ParD family antitoxin [Mesorhizobium sp. GbtcB19]
MTPLKETQDRLRLEQLRKAIDEGDRSGDPQPFDIESFIEMKKRPRDLGQ